MNPPLFEKENFEQWKPFLEENGYVVIKNVLSSKEINHGLDLFRKDWNHVSPNFDFNDPITWTTDNSPMMWGKGMTYTSGFGQCDFQWYLRTRDNIINIWKHVHNTEQLVVSFDGFSVFLSHKQKPKNWLHVDQANSEKTYSIQGAYNFNPVSEYDAGFIVVPKSHKTFKTEHSKKTNFIRIDENDPHTEKAVKLLIPGNCFVLWNSKTIHANAGITSRGKKYNSIPYINRITSYITYFPKEMRSDEIYKKRLDGYKNGDNCSHWSIYHHVKKHPFGLKKRYENRNFNRIQPVLDENENIPKERFDLI